MKFIVKDALGKIEDKGYYTAHHAEQMARALNLHDALRYALYYGGDRFTVVSL